MSFPSWARARKGLLILEEEMRAVSHELLITTDDGSCGEHGFVTDVLRRLLTERGDIKLITATGPVPMMKAVSLLAREFKVPSMASLNSIMVDGTGMCGACRVTVGGKPDLPAWTGRSLTARTLTMMN